MQAPEVEIRANAIPEELKARRQWVCWRMEDRGGKPTKVPYSPKPRGKRGALVKASANDPATWGTYPEAVKRARKRGMAGVGFVFTVEDSYCGVDLDGCRDPETGELAGWAAEIVAALGSYSEASPSGTGVHIIARGAVPAGGNRKGAVEMYDRGRFFTVTGEALDGTSAKIGERQAELEELHRRLFPPKPSAGAPSNGRRPANVPELSDDALLERARSAKNGERFARLWAGDRSGYASDSEADLALCSMFGFWTRNEGLIDRLFRRSGLYRPKWERQDYRERTIRKAVENRTEVWSSFARADGAPAVLPETNGHTAPSGSAPVLPTIPQGALFTDVGNARRFFDSNGPDLRHCGRWGKWLVYGGKRWSLDWTHEVQKRAKGVAVGIFQEAADAGRNGLNDLSQKLNKHAIRSQSASSIDNMIKLARDEMPVSPDRLDRGQWLLNVENGTLDLKTGELREHRREDLITKLAPVAYDPKAKAPVWEATLERILPDPEVRAYFKRLVGYSITGDVSEQVLPVLYGTGANGKSTVLNTLLAALGDYGMQAPPDLLISKRDAHPTELADLHGQRFVASIEVEDGRRFAEPLVKQLTGGDRIKARRMREDFWEFDPTHKIFMAVNHKPLIRGTDLGIWRRIHLIPFTETIPPEEQDKKLPERLREELVGVLAWAVEGCLEWQKEGLKPPEAVKAATEEYRREMDTLAAFISECCVEGPDKSVQAKPLYEAYKEWCEENGERYENNNTFSRQLTERGYEREKGKHVRYYGLALRPKDDDPGGLLTPEPPDDGAPPPGDEDAPPAPERTATTNGAPLGASSAGRTASAEEVPDPDVPAEVSDPPAAPPAKAVSKATPEGVSEAEDVGVRVREVLRKSWAKKQLELVRAGDGRLLSPLANAVACELFGSPYRWQEVRPFVEQAATEGGET